MKNCNTVYFSILDCANADAALIELLCAATLEYSDFLIISNSRTLLIDTAEQIYSTVQIRPQGLLVPAGSVLATAEHFLKYSCRATYTERRFVKFDPYTGLTSESIQFCSKDLTIDAHNPVYHYKNTNKFHPIVKHTIETACAEQMNSTAISVNCSPGVAFCPILF